MKKIGRKTVLDAIKVFTYRQCQSLKTNFFIVGLVSLLWYVLRTGTKPSRATYPCQKAAAFNVQAWAALYIFPVYKMAKKKYKKPILIGVALFLLLNVFNLVPFNPFMQIQAGDQDIFLNLVGQEATLADPSDVFVVSGTNGHDNGFNRLINLMGDHDTLFYKSSVVGANQGPDGLFSRDDVIIIKVNCQWNMRGGTNTDLLKSMIETITDHPDGFTGEIVVADNGQDQHGAFNLGGSLDWDSNNAEDITQSVQDVVDMFSSFQVSTYLWDDITNTPVAEYDQGDLNDGYVVSTYNDPETGIRVSYPKFRTYYGTYISFKMGVWDSQNGYDSEKLKVINVPVLKTHSNYGVTACVKHYMGVPSDKLVNGNAHDKVDEGGMGTLMAETRIPTLNVLDAIWINAHPRGGPGTSYSEASRVNVTMVSVDPVALDYWAAKHVLMQAAFLLDEPDLYLIDPDNTNTGSFGYWLSKSMEEIESAGYRTTNVEEQMNVYISSTGSIGSSVEIDEFSVSDDRVDMSDSVTVGFHASWANDGSDVTYGTITVNGVNYNLDTSGWARFDETSTAVTRETWAVTAVNCGGITDFVQTCSDPSIIWDRIKVTYGRISEDRVNVGDPIEYRARAYLDYDWHPLSTEDTLVSNAGAMTYDPDPDHIWFEVQRVQNDVGEFDFHVISAAEETYGITATVIVVSDPKGIWDRVEVYDGGASPTSVEVGETITIWFKARYGYDSVEFDDSVGALYVNGVAAVWSSSGERWELPVTKSTTGSYLYAVSGFSDSHHGLTVMSNQVGDVTATWYEPGVIDINSAQTSDNRCDVGSTQTISYHASYSEGGDVTSGIIYVNGTGYTPDSSGWVSFQESSDVIVRKKWRVTGVDVTGVTDFVQTCSDPSIIWDRIKVTYGRISEDRVNVGDPIEYRARAYLDYDWHPLSTEDTLVSNAGAMTYDPDPDHIWFEVQRVQNDVGEFDFHVISAAEETYGITATVIVVSDPKGIWDRVEVYDGGASPTSVEVGETITIWFKARYGYDSVEFDDSVGA
ncbi:hypothetical protein MCGE09_00062, partial [Thaumarchaeota archaeon SCGC AB-539-E09]